MHPKVIFINIFTPSSTQMYILSKEKQLACHSKTSPQGIPSFLVDWKTKAFFFFFFQYINSVVSSALPSVSNFSTVLNVGKTAEQLHFTDQERELQKG